MCRNVGTGRVIVTGTNRMAGKRRKSTVERRKTEAVELKRQIRSLQSELEELQPSRTLEQTVVENAALNCTIREQQLSVARAQSAFASHSQGSHPLHTPIVLKKSWDSRKATLLAIRAKKLRAAYEYVTMRREASLWGQSCLSDDSIGVKSGCACVDDMFFMLQNITVSAVELLDCGYDVSAVQDQCSALRSNIGGLLDALNKQTAKRYVLPGPTALQQLQQLHCGVKIVSPKTLRDSYSAESNDERHDRAWHNLEGCYFIDGTSCNLKALLRWEESITAPALYKQILVLRTIEAFVFKIAYRLNKDSDGKTIGLESIQTLVTKYQQVVARWRKLPRLTSVLEVEQQSREMLVMWIAFCLAHQKCAKQVPLCKQYNIALDWKDLEVAVLSDRAAITALQHAAIYIRRWNKRVGGPPLFNLSDQSPTFDFGLKYAQSCSRLLAIYDQEVKIWEGHMESMWRTVEQKKRKAVDLRAEICRLNRNLRLKQSELDQEVQRLNSMYPYNERRYRARHWRESDTKTQLAREVEHTEAAIRRTTGQLTTTLKAPTYQVRPLPALSDDALQIIFMLNIPRNIEILGNLCLTAQRALAPTEPTPDMMTLPSVSPTTWTQFYYQHAPSRGFCATAKVFTVSPAPFSLPRSWGPDTVDDLWSLAQYKKDCVWNPCILGTAQTWIDSSGANVNPFGVCCLGHDTSSAPCCPKDD